MALSAIMLAWLDHLAEIGAVPGGSMLELGPQDLVTTPAVSAEFLRRRLPAEAAEQAIGRLSGDSPTDRPQVEIYRALGIDTYVSVDFDDARADVQHDLNEPLTLDRRFDVVTNFGTAEHIFEVATVLRSQYRHLAVGGIAMSVIPAFGQINHGFYNLHPTLWTDLAVANNMQVAAFHYVDDIISRSEQLDAAGTCRLDFDSLPIKPLDG